MTDDDVDTIDETLSPVSNSVIDELLSRGRRQFCRECFCSPCECAVTP